MDIREFMTLPQIINMNGYRNPQIGDKFLTGTKVIAQVDLKEVGQEITWYEITNINERGIISYTPRYGRLEAPKMEDNK